MANETDKAGKGKTRSSTLLPSSLSSSGKLSASGRDVPRKERAANEPAISAELAAGLQKAGTEAKELASRAAALAADKAPEIKQAAQQAGAKVTDLAGKAFKQASVSARAAGDKLADPATKGRAMVFAHWKAVMGVVVLVVLLGGGGGWLYAGHRATAMAKNRIDGFLIRNNLSNKVSYRDISASPFGTATISDIQIKVTPTASIKVSSVKISDIAMKAGQLRGGHFTADHIMVPMLTLARDRSFAGSDTAHGWVSLGYTKLQGNVALSFDYDDQKGTFNLNTRGDFQDAGTWNLTLKVGNIDPSFANFVYSHTNSQASFADPNNPAVAIQALRGLSHLTLSRMDIAIDNSGLHSREQALTGTAVPPSTAPVASSSGLSVADLVRAGMAPSDAEDMIGAYSKWARNGGTLRLATALDQPVPIASLVNWQQLFAVVNSNPAAAPAVMKTQVGKLLVDTKAQVSN